MMAKAIVYTRVSDTKQIDSIEGQRAFCREWCKANNLEVACVFVETGESAKSADRPEFQAMFKYLTIAAKGSVSHVVVYKFDRFSRDVEDGSKYRLKLHSLGIKLCSATEETDDSPTGKFLTSLLSAVHEFDKDVRGTGEGER